MFDHSLTLANGVKIPQLALGTWLIDDSRVRQVALDAIHIGYRHIDTAQAYDNEKGVGYAVRHSGISRDKLFITSKVAAEIKSYPLAAKSIDESLRVSGLDYMDLMLIHCPQPWAEYEKNPYRYVEENRSVWRALEEAYRAGKVRAIGVSNFNETDISNLCDAADVMPMVNQVFCHAGNTPMNLIRFCQQRGIVMEAYSPVAHGRALTDKPLISMAERYGVSVAQLCIRYCLQLGMVALPKSTQEKHIEQNSQLNFNISEADMRLLG